MNLQAQMAGQYARQVSNQGGTSLQQPQNMMQHSEGHQASISMEARAFIQEKM